MATNLKLPDFLIIGAGKSGTTSLNNYLKQHPQIYIPDLKEPNFFGYELYSEKDFEGKPILEHYRGSVTDIDSYLELFKPATDEQLLGETSNTYLYHDKAPERIQHYIPKTKLIAIFRHPVERLYSRFLHLAREDRLPSDEFIDCLDRNSIWWQRNDLINEGFYHKHLSRYYSKFDHSNIKIFLYEDLQNNAQKLLRDIFFFLAVNPDFEPDTSVDYNKSGFIKNKFYNAIFGQKSVLKNVIVSMIPKAGYTQLKNSITMQKYLNRVRSYNLSRPVLDGEIKKKITREVYEDDILKLSKLIKRDLNHWINF